MKFYIRFAKYSTIFFLAFLLWFFSLVLFNRYYMPCECVTGYQKEIYHKPNDRVSVFAQVVQRNPTRWNSEELLRVYKSKGNHLSPSKYRYFSSLTVQKLKTLNMTGARCEVQDFAGSMRAAFVVISSPTHFESRKAIRETWGLDVKRLGGKVVFLIGLTEEEITRKAVIKESEKHLDLINVDLKEDYYNLTAKSLSLVKWYISYCVNAKFVVKVDDDVVVNVTAVYELLTSSQDGNFVYGHVHTHPFPDRNEKSKWFLPKSVYPWRYYPEYCNGPFYIITLEAAIKMYKVSEKVPLFFLEDVYITGMLTSLSGTKILHVPTISTVATPSGCCGVMANPGNKPEEIRILWNLSTLPGDDKCTLVHTNLKRGQKPKQLEPFVKSTILGKNSCRKL